MCSEASGTPAIRVRQISKCFQLYSKPIHRLWQMLWHGKKTFYRTFRALDDISFDVQRGECVGIIGRNGAGKSTLLQIITGTLAPTSGTVEMTGRVAALLELGSGFNPEFTGRENIWMNAAILGLSEKEIAERYDDIVAFAEIGDFIEQPVKSYSSGMVVRLAFAV
ncbi:MAG: ABC transporter ATP-binding protein, partial [Deltaproteobacteria bacterium]|nr:ABC transporter ATP-binding protein [Deltaproteobacteria bacterium]